MIKEHQTIVRAPDARIPVAAEAAVRAHLGKSLGIVDQVRAEYPDYFL